MHLKFALFILYTLTFLFEKTVQAQALIPEDADSISAAVLQGKSLSQARLRYEYVNEENKPQDANAFTLRTLVGWQTAAIHHLSLGLQALDVTHLNHAFYDNFMDRDQPSRFPTVADPEITDINQLFLDYTGIKHNHVRLGRQIVRLDNARFLGESPFRQIPQIFDGFTLRNQSLQDTEFFLGHYDHLRQSNARYRSANIDVLHLTYQYLPKANVVTYGYFIGLSDTGQNTGATDNAHRDLGIRFDGTVDINDEWYWMHTFEYAQQTPYQGGSSMIHASYSKMGLGIGYVDFYVRLDQERLSSNHGVYAFQTPLAPLHSFQGWTDLFTTTPQQGMVDRFLSIVANWQAYSIQAQWHALYSDTPFQSTSGYGSHYGNELDMSLSYQWSRRFQTKFEYANFSEAEVDGASMQSASRKRDTTKAWVTLMYAF